MKVNISSHLVVCWNLVVHLTNLNVNGEVTECFYCVGSDRDCQDPFDVSSIFVAKEKCVSPKNFGCYVNKILNYLSSATLRLDLFGCGFLTFSTSDAN